MPAIKTPDGRWVYGTCCCCGDPPAHVDDKDNLLCSGCWPHWKREVAEAASGPRPRWTLAQKVREMMK